jgi:BirA family transcriptional regulator, biotin operon repressor / biotin---[acetyl-CoA-carboxylase] ligase
MGLGVSRLMKDMGTSRIEHVHLSECDSTQLILKEQLHKSAGKVLLVSTERQLQGRGRGENTWESLPGTLCFSLTIDPHPVPSFTALELSVIITKFFEGSKLSLKWPNDVLNSHNKKCCGILIQTFGGAHVAGFGINLWSHHPDYGGVFDLSFEFSKKLWCRELAEFVLANRIPDVVTLKGEWENVCCHLNTMVEITESNHQIIGSFVGLGVHGEAILSTPEGAKHFYNGSLRIF